MSSNSASVLIVAAEESSCKYAIQVMHKIKSQNPNVKFFGVGNLEMEKMGFKRLARSEDLAVMGLFEIYKSFAKIKKAYNNILENVDQYADLKVALLLDYGGFNLKLAKDLKLKNVKVIYYIPPKIWVWKKNRVYQIKKYVDDVLVVHPFEVELYKKYGVHATYVGHPLLEEFEAYKKSNFLISAFKKKLGLDGSVNVGLMPGSRNSEVDRLLNLMLDAAEQLLKLKQNLNISVLVAPGFEIEDFKSRLKRTYDFPIYFIKEDSWRMIDLCDFMMTASGTATLQVALLKKPQIIVYRMNIFSGWLSKLIVRGVKHFGLVNIILDQNLCPEVFQSSANPENMANLTYDLLINKNSSQTQMLQGYQNLEQKLKGEGPSKLVSECVIKYLNSDYTKL